MDTMFRAALVMWFMWLSSVHNAFACEHPPCELQEKPGPTSVRSCNWHILKQDLTVFIPTIQSIDVEASCPHHRFGDLNLDQCNKCAAMHQPCNDQFTACKGCCGTSWHLEGTSYLVPNSHSCDALKAYYLHKNSVNLTCGSDTDPNIGPLVVHVENRSLYSGKVESKCMSVTKHLQCDTAPTKLKFECDVCNAGVPDLLTQCCDKCMEFANGTDVLNLRREQGIEAYVWCSGCDTTTVRSATGMPYTFDPSPYASRTEAAADLNMTKWVVDNVCSKFEHQCASTTSTTSTTTTTTTTHFLQHDELLYFGQQRDTAAKSDWSCWRGTCGVTSGNNHGKRNAYNNLKLGSVTFSCHDSSSNLVWYAEYELSSAYSDRPLKDIVLQCTGSHPSNTGDAKWNNGRCRHVGSKTSYHCPAGGTQRCSATPSNELRIALGDGSIDKNDWMLFAFQDGNSNDYSASSYFMGLGGEDTVGTQSCKGGYLYIHGREARMTRTTLATTLTTTTTSTQCLDLCFEKGRGLRQVEDGRFRRLQVVDNVADTSDSCQGFDVTAFWQSLPVPSLEEIMKVIEESNVTNLNVSLPGVDPGVTLVPVSSVVISGLGEGWSSSTLQAACRAGFALNLNANPLDLAIELEFDAADDSFTATAKAPNAKYYDAPGTVHFDVQKSLFVNKPRNNQLENLKVVKRMVITDDALENSGTQGNTDDAFENNGTPGKTDDALESNETRGNTDDVLENNGTRGNTDDVLENNGTRGNTDDALENSGSRGKTDDSLENEVTQANTDDALENNGSRGKTDDALENEETQTSGSIVFHFSSWLKAGLFGAAVVRVIA